MFSEVEVGSTYVVAKQTHGCKSTNGEGIVTWKRVFGDHSYLYALAGTP
jgi:hypothetical protein